MVGLVNEQLIIDDADARMKRLLGEERAREVREEILREIGGSLVTADDVYRFASALDRRGGLLSALGSALKVKAILSGATAGT